MFTNWSMGKKLMSGKILLFVLAVSLGAWQMYSLETFNAQFKVLAGKRTKTLLLSNQLSLLDSEMISAQRGIILASFANDPAELVKYQKGFQKSGEQLVEANREVAALAATPEAKQLTDDIQEAWSAWEPHYRDVVQQASAGNVAEANRIRKVITAPIYNRIAKDAKRITELEGQVVTSTQETLQSEYNRSNFITGILIALFVAVSVVVALVVRQTTKALRSAVSQLTEGAEQVGSAAVEVASASQALASGASQQAAALEETSASTEQIGAMSRKNRGNVTSAAELMTRSQDQIRVANESLLAMVAAMNEISASSESISKIIRVIDEISFQTNILALNAAVEAARAGEAGLGFAVVADEVRTLAQRCAQAARDTSLLIEDSIAKSGEGKTRLDRVATSVRAITEQSEGVKSLIEAVQTATLEQDRGLAQITSAMSHMDHLTQKNASSAEESASAAQELTSQSEGLRTIVAQLSVMAEGA